MEFGKNLGKGLWGIADKGLPVVYGVGFVALAIRVLPATELGNFVLFQEIFLVVTGLITALTTQPLLKFVAEDRPSHAGVIGAAVLLSGVFSGLSSVLAVFLRAPAGVVFNAPGLAVLMLSLPALIAASFIRNITIVLLQARLRMRSLFVTDAAHFLGAPLLMYLFSKLHAFNTADDLVRVNLYSFSTSSLVGLWCSRSLLRPAIPSRQDVREVWDYGRFFLGSIVSNLFYSRADAFFLAAFTGPVQVAVYTSVKIFVRVYDMVLQVVQVFVLPTTARLASHGEMDRLRAVGEKAITFTIVALLPVTLLFLVSAPWLVGVMYQGRYTDAAPMLQLFSLLSFSVPVVAVATNVLLGVGQARATFVLGMQALGVAILLYLGLTPLLGPMGAAAGYVLTSTILSLLAVRRVRPWVVVTPAGIIRRTGDIRSFVKDRWARWRLRGV